MNREKMLYHAKEKGCLNFDIYTMKRETRDNLDFLLDGDFLDFKTDSAFGNDRNSKWQEYVITNRGIALLGVYRLEYAHLNERDTEKHIGRIEQLRELLDVVDVKLTDIEYAFTNNQRKSVNYMNTNYPTGASTLVHKIKEQEKSVDTTPNDELSLLSLFEFSTELGKKGSSTKRSDDYVLKKCMEELGELALEVTISQGESYKEPGKDGVKGEAVDLAICALDMFALQCNNMSPEEIEREFLTYMTTKVNKWRNTLK